MVTVHSYGITTLTITLPVVLMLLFAVVMILASISMIKTKVNETIDKKKPDSYRYASILLNGTGVGLLTGLIGIGGGFLIIPALVLLARMPMGLAVGTSLIIITANSIIGFIGDLQGSYEFDWKLLGTFTGLAIAGIFIGSGFSKKIPEKNLKKGVGWFVLAMGIYIIIRESFFQGGAGIVILFRGILL